MGVTRRLLGCGQRVRVALIGEGGAGGRGVGRGLGLVEGAVAGNGVTAADVLIVHNATVAVRSLEWHARMGADREGAIAGRGGTEARGHRAWRRWEREGSGGVLLLEVGALLRQQLVLSELVLWGEVGGAKVTDHRRAVHEGRGGTSNRLALLVGRLHKGCWGAARELLGSCWEAAGGTSGGMCQLVSGATGRGELPVGMGAACRGARSGIDERKRCTVAWGSDAMCNSGVFHRA